MINAAPCIAAMLLAPDVPGDDVAAHDDKSRLDDRDNDFLVRLIVKSLPSILMETCGLSHADPREADIISEVMRASLRAGA